ncbi:hypothetical protein [Paenarthrobacter sp. TA1.8]
MTMPTVSGEELRARSTNPAAWTSEAKILPKESQETWLANPLRMFG